MCQSPVGVPIRNAIWYPGSQSEVRSQSLIQLRQTLSSHLRSVDLSTTVIPPQGGVLFLERHYPFTCEAMMSICAHYVPFFESDVAHICISSCLFCAKMLQYLREVCP